MYLSKVLGSSVCVTVWMCWIFAVASSLFSPSFFAGSSAKSFAGCVSTEGTTFFLLSLFKGSFQHRLFHCYNSKFKLTCWSGCRLRSSFKLTTKLDRNQACGLIVDFAASAPKKKGISTLTNCWGLRTTPRPRNIFTQEVSGEGEANVISEALLGMTKQRFYVVCQVYAKKRKKKKINATWQRYIKSLCAVIFLFYFCLGCRESLSKAQRGAEPERTMWDPGRRENGTCCLFSAASSVTFFFILTDHFTCQHHPSDQMGYTEPSTHPVVFSPAEPQCTTTPCMMNRSPSGWVRRVGAWLPNHCGLTGIHCRLTSYVGNKLMVRLYFFAYVSDKYVVGIYRPWNWQNILLIFLIYLCCEEKTSRMFSCFLARSMKAVNRNIIAAFLLFFLSFSWLLTLWVITQGIRTMNKHLWNIC